VWRYGGDARTKGHHALILVQCTEPRPICVVSVVRAEPMGGMFSAGRERGGEVEEALLCECVAVEREREREREEGEEGEGNCRRGGGLGWGHERGMSNQDEPGAEGDFRRGRWKRWGHRSRRVVMLHKGIPDLFKVGRGRR
jgi:hypothetical protein